MKKLKLLFTAFLVTQGTAQTKMIHFKSHSGSAHHFSMTLALNPSHFETSNFGVGPQRYVRNSNLDSVILLSEHTAIMVTSESCGFEDYDGRGQSHSEIWSAGRDTVKNHPLFNGNNSLKTIKTVLKNDYYFTNPIEKVVFVGFEKNNAEKEELGIAEQHPTKKHTLKNQEEDIPKKNRPSFFMIIILSLFTTLFRRPF
jgi:hypothetical protein